ncbi:YkoF family thiamine/hydroxymethylpyrimidine-binding protein [Chromatiaceae bacterium AAb-1]|nr:YkoF family thiamine/hydroxymethylpyrimidine-binding protein [Chromatiaceae bacterium AAb-1]
MKLTVDISKYPLANDYIPPIKGFIEQLNQYPDVKVITNALSTQVSGDYDQVMQLLQQSVKWSFERYGKVVFVCKFLHGDLLP